MKSSRQKILVNHNALDLYNIVLDIEKYPEYIPWCTNIEINSKKRNEILADMIVKYKLFLPQKFTSHVQFNKKKLQIKTNYIDGPLKDLKTEWVFKFLKEKKTRIFFEISFEFEKIIHQKIAEIFFALIEKKMINSFLKRADELLN